MIEDPKKHQLFWKDNLTKNIFASSPDAITVIDLNGNITECNQAALNMLGYSSKDEVIGRSGFALVAEKDREKAKGNLKKVLDHGSIKNVEYIALTKDGTEFSAELSASVIKDPSGNPIGFMAITKDVTERKKAEEELRNTKSYLDNLLNYANAPIIVWDNVKRITLFNNAFEIFTGHKKESMLGRNIDILFPLLQKEKSLQTIEGATKGKKWESVEIPILCKGKETKIALWNSANITDKEGKIVATIAQGQDITERKMIEEKLEESEKKFKSIFEGARDGILAADVKTKKFVLANPRICEITGYSEKELLRLGVEDIHPKKDLPYVIDTFTKMLQRKIEIGRDMPVLRKDRTVAYCDINPYLLEVGGRKLLVGLFRDVTERRKVEEERREVMEKLEVTNDKLRVVGGLTRHDVRNKLVTVKGNAYLARNKLSGNSEVLDYLKQIEVSVEQIVRILEFAKAYELLGVEELVYVDVEKAVNEAVSLFPHLKDIKVINDCPGLTVLADSLLRQLFFNLIDNSLKYGEKLSRIRVFYEEKNSSHLKVIYEDDGVGIPQAVKLKLFDEGYTTGKGSGYGLFLVKKMMEVYGWTIQETGTLGKGAQFTMTIPRVNKKGKENYRLS